SAGTYGVATLAAFYRRLRHLAPGGLAWSASPSQPMRGAATDPIPLGLQFSQGTRVDGLLAGLNLAQPIVVEGVLRVFHHRTRDKFRGLVELRVANARRMR